jgi:single-strand DNA-binding protein
MELMGNLGNDPDCQLTSGGSEIAKFDVCEKYTYLQNGKWESRDVWHKVVVWGLNTFINNYFKKGSPIFVVGRLEPRKNEYNGKTYYWSELVAQEIRCIEKNSTKQSQPPFETGD